MFRCLNGGSPGDFAPRASLWQPGGCCKGQDRATGPFSRSGHAFCLHQGIASTCSYVLTVNNTALVSVILFSKTSGTLCCCHGIIEA